MQRLKILLVGAFMLTGFAVSAQARVQPNASVFVQDLADRAIANLTEAGLTAEERELRFRALFRDGFAITGIAKFTLGRYWRSANEQQRAEYLALFEDVIVDAWATRFTKYSGQQFEITEESSIPGTANQNTVIVRSLIWASPDTPIRVNWRVASAGDIYKITDVIVEGISMANTQRDEFASLVRNNGFAGLLASLRTKSGQSGDLAALVVAQQYEILPASGDAPPAGGNAPPAVAEQEPVPVQAGTLAIQLASLRSPTRAEVAWQQLLAKYPSILRGRELSVEQVDLADRGTFYRVRTGAFARFADARNFCRQLTDVGQDCLVVQR